MNKELEIQLKEIKKKVYAGTPLTREEEFLYLTNVMGHSKDEANTIITIAENEDKLTLID